MIACTLVAGGTGAGRIATIVDRLDPDVATAAIFEGIHPQHPALHDPVRPAPLSVSTIAPDCPCCGGGMVLRVTLDRMIRRRPARLFISMADADHLPHLRQFLSAEPYRSLLELTSLTIA